MKIIKEALLLLRGLKGERKTSLQIRLFIFLACFVLGLAMAFILLLMMTGVFNAGEKENRQWLENEISHIAESVYADFGKLSVNGTQYASMLSKDIDNWFLQNDITAADLSEHPELLDDLLSSQTPYLLSSLQTNQCSGTFIILNASMNSKGENTSKAGIFLKQTEPNKVNSIASKVYFLRGPAEVARNYGIGLLGQWQMEFDVSQSDYFNLVMQTAKNNIHLATNRLYYWKDRILLEGNSESGMLLCMPLISQDGTVYGICGFEFSSMLFKLSYSPDNNQYAEIFATVSPVKEGNLNTEAGLIAGNSYLTNQAAGEFSFNSDMGERVTEFESSSGVQYVGMHQPLKLYASDSPYKSDVWEVAVMMPKQNWKEAAKGNNDILLIAIILLLLFSLLASVGMSRYYIRPVVVALEMIKDENIDVSDKRTNIMEIDDLLEYLTRQDEQREALRKELESTRKQHIFEQEKTPDLTTYQEFIHNIDTLSTAERAVFDLYMQGLTAREIADTLFLSMNTIKTHNKRIYMKLNVSSLKELMVYVQMMTGTNNFI